MTGWTRPEALGGLGAAAALALMAAAHFRWKARVLPRLGDPVLLRAMTDGAAPRRQRLKAALSVAAAALAALALAGPRWGQSYETARRRGADVMIAVDVSASMLAEDLAPNRLAHAKRALGRVIDGMEGDRVGVVAFAGAAVLQCPLTTDRDAARSLLDLVDASLVPVGGTNLSAALNAAVDSFPPGRARKAVVLLTDGEDRSGDWGEAVRRAAEAGAQIFAIGLGTPSGEVIPLRDEQGRVVDYKKDKSGKTVVSKLGEAALREASERTGGTYARATPGETEIDRLIERLRDLEKRALEDRSTRRGKDRYQVPLALAVFLLVLELLWPERRRAALGLSVLFFLAPISAGASGKEPRDVREWRARAHNSPQDPGARWSLGHSLYKSGDAVGAAAAFDDAHRLFDDPSRKADAAYNAGNALAQAGKLSDALERYKKALRLKPGDEDARHNYEWLRRQMKGKVGGARPGEGNGEEAPAQAPMKPGDLSPEDAERILQAVERQEKDARRKDRMAAPKSSSEEDW